MKQLLFIFFCILSFVSNAQNDTTKYFKSYDYGWSYPRIKIRNAFILPSDTINNKLGFAMLNNMIYIGDGTKWISPQNPINPKVSIDSSLHIPSFCGVPQILDNIYNTGAIAIDTCNNVLFQWTKTFGWSPISTGTYLDTNGLSNRINNKIDSLIVSGDSVFTLKYKYIGGVLIQSKVFQFLKGSGTANAIDSLRKSSDSIYARKNGIFGFQFKDSIGKFTKNIEIRGSTSVRLGKYTGTGTTSPTIVPVAGLDLDSAFKIICQEAIIQNYTRPTATMASNISAGTYDIGRSFNLSFSYTPTPNDADTAYNVVYFLNNSAFSGNTYNLTLSNTSTQTFKGAVYFRKTPPSKYKVNNLGQIDTLRIVPDTAVTASPTYSYTGRWKRYWGYTTQYNPPADSVKLTLGGGSEFATSGVKSLFNINTLANETRYIFYAFPTTFNDITSIKISGNESYTTFHKDIITISNGYTSTSFYVYTSNNAVSGNIPNIEIQ